MLGYSGRSLDTGRHSQVEVFNRYRAVSVCAYVAAISHMIFQKLYAKLQAYAGQRLNQVDLEQRAWNFLNTNTTGVYPPAVSVGGTDVLNPVTEVRNSHMDDVNGS
jgi:hypothetical protein